MLSNDTLVRRVRVRASAADALRMQQRVVALTAGADLHGPSLSRAAILCIRTLGDPLPRSIGLTDHRVRPTTEWEAAARSRIAELAERAARPALGAVPASAEAVLFLDRAELLACLASDWTGGLLASCWWWRALFGTMDVAGVVRAWRETPEHVPAACHLLATWRRLDRFIQRLSGTDAAALTRDVARTFGLDVVDRELGRFATERRDKPGSIHSEPAIEAVRKSADAPAPDPPGWLRYVPELTHAAMSPEQHLLAVVTLVVHRSPSTARRILSLDAVQSILTGKPAAPVEHQPAAARPSAHEAGDDAREDAGEPLLHVVDAGGTDARPLDERTRDSLTPGPAPGVSEDEAVEALTQAALARPPAPRPVSEIVETQFGGVFHLINVGIALGLYGDFTTPGSPGIELPIWDFIVLVGDRLMNDERFRNDPVVPFLARLAGRDPSDPPGATFVPAGAETLEEWLDALVPRIRTCVAAALAVNEDAAASLMLRRAARVSLSPSHLDIAFALEDLPIQIRLAGLDRDPGFVPAAGLTVTFSYA